LLSPEGVELPVGGKTHFSDRDFRVFSEKIKKTIFPLSGIANLSQPKMADRQHETHSVGCKARLDMPLRIFVFARNGRLYPEDR